MTITPSKPIPKKFFHFHQNNSGGSWDKDAARGIGKNIWVEADDYLQANALAERIGLYWNGCENGRDCPCCGDRWSALWDHDKGKDTPETTGYYAQNAYVHYADGRIEQIHAGLCPQTVWEKFHV